MKSLTRQFEKNTGHKLILSFGSTGKHYAQIRHGAPFDIFLAADARRPALLIEEGVAVSGSRVTYAIGRLALWSAKTGFIDSDGQVLLDEKFRRLALANPKLAPYGMAAREVLQHLGIWNRLQGRIVLGENIAQAYQFIHSGNAELGFVSLSQISQPGKPLNGSYWLIPEGMYSPIEQQLVIINDSPGVQAFLSFLKSARALAIIESSGYGHAAGHDELQ